EVRRDLLPARVSLAGVPIATDVSTQKAAPFRAYLIEQRDHVEKRDALGRPRQPKAAPSSPGRVENAAPREPVDGLRELVPRDAERGGHLVDADRLVALPRHKRA